MTYNFIADIEKFHAMYKLPQPAFPTTEAVGKFQVRQVQFLDTLEEEVEEGADLFDLAKNAKGYSVDLSLDKQKEMEVLVAMADWLGDMIVYCTSEASRYGIPIQAVLQVIMESNFSKLDENGEPIIKNGKVQKGLNYFKPEPKIKELLEKHVRNAK